MDKIPFGKQMFPEPVYAGRRTFKLVSNKPSMTIIEDCNNEDRWVTLDEEEATAFALAHPAVKALVEVAKEIGFVLRGNDLYVSAQKLTKALAPFEG